MLDDDSENRIEDFWKAVDVDDVKLRSDKWQSPVFCAPDFWSGDGFEWF